MTGGRSAYRPSDQLPECRGCSHSSYGLLGAELTSARNTLRAARHAVRRAEAATLSREGLPANLRRSAGLGGGVAPPVGYLGFAGRGNAGDDAILLAHRRSLPTMDLALLPLEWERETLAVLDRVRRSRLHSGVLVGGGTVVGREAWRRRLDLAQRRCPGPIVFTGVGIEDPAFHGEMQHTHGDELSRWKDVLSDAAHLTVRGPLSAQLLRDIGIEAPYVSDPALLLGPDQPEGSTFRPKLLGLNIADPEDQYRGTRRRVFDACTAAVRTLLQSGWTVRLLPFTRRDLILARALCQALNGRVDIVASFADVDRLLALIAECDVLVGQRLHAVVFAAAVAVPALAVDYRPKCRDFQLSIGRGEWTVSTLDITGDMVVDGVTRLHEARTQHAGQIHDAVVKAKSALRDGERFVARALAAREGTVGSLW